MKKLVIRKPVIGGRSIEGYDSEWCLVDIIDSETNKGIKFLGMCKPWALIAMIPNYKRQYSDIESVEFEDYSIFDEYVMKNSSSVGV